MIVNKNESAKLTATVHPLNAVNMDVNWSSSNPDVAKVDQTGKVVGVGTGFAVITATSKDGGFTGNCDVEVQV